jgi:hypothetical protein
MILTSRGLQRFDHVTNTGADKERMQNFGVETSRKYPLKTERGIGGSVIEVSSF